MDTKEFIEKAKKVHGNKYDYSKVKYVNTNIKVKIICREHGIFEQTPEAHYRLRQGCPICNSLVTESEIRDLVTKITRLQFKKVRPQELRG